MSKPLFKVFNERDEYVATTNDAAVAACIVAFLGDGSTIRYGDAKKHIAWREGFDGEAGASYDEVCIKCYEMVDRRRAEEQKALELERAKGEQR